MAVISDRIIGTHYRKSGARNNAVEKERAAKAVPKFMHKENATLAQCIEIMDWYHANGKNQMATAAHFSKKYSNLKLKQPLVLGWLKNEQTWQQR